ncbi:MAG: formylglycine-generating enzyme family protein [Pirellulaceae bacterium]
MMWPRFACWVVFALYGLLPFVSLTRPSLGAERRNPITNTIGMKLVLIPAGDFMMGSRETPEEVARAVGGKPAYFTDEQPSHRVRITKPFYLGTHEVTRGQFRQFIDDSGHDPEGSWRKVDFEQTDEHPVVGVSWNDATAFCKWLSRKESKTYRLPTEAEWEYACRAGSTTYYFNGDDPEDLALIGNVAIRGSEGYAYTAPVGKFRANGFGLYDMHGNVWEWCADWYDEAYYKDSPSEDPAGPATGSDRVVRGGCWGLTPRYCRSAGRVGAPPDHWDYYLGFRVALVPVDASGR